MTDSAKGIGAERQVLGRKLLTLKRGILNKILAIFIGVSLPRCEFGASLELDNHGDIS